jgi:hypothetical protein
MTMKINLAVLAINVSFYLIACVICGWAILSPRVRDGTIGKIGLMCCSVGFAAMAIKMSDGFASDDLWAIANVMVLINIGAALLAAEWAWRSFRARRVLRRMSDWMDLDTASEG